MTMIRVSRFEIPYRIYGTSGRSMVLLNGAQQTRAAWRSIIQEFSRDHRVVVFDNPGQGSAVTLSGEASFTFEEQIEVVRAVVDTVSREPVILFAASWGSIVALAYAARHAARVSHLVIGSASARPNAVLRSLVREGQSLADVGRACDLGSFIVERLGRGLSPALKEQICRQFQTAHESKIRAFYAHSSFVANAEDIRDFVDMQKIEARTLMVFGDLDPLVEEEDLARFRAGIRGVRMLIAKNVGHFLHWEQPELIARYREFLQEPA